MRILNKIAQTLQTLSTCPDCNHSAPAGVAGCNCSRSDCSC
jgi:hypothetical protein